MTDFNKMKALSEQIEGLGKAIASLKQWAGNEEARMHAAELNSRAANLASRILEKELHELRGQLNALRVQQELDEEAAKNEPELRLNKKPPLPDNPVHLDKNGNPKEFIVGKSITFAPTEGTKKKLDD